MCMCRRPPQANCRYAALPTTDAVVLLMVISVSMCVQCVCSNSERTVNYSMRLHFRLYSRNALRKCWLHKPTMFRTSSCYLLCYVAYVCLLSLPVNGLILCVYLRHSTTLRLSDAGQSVDACYANIVKYAGSRYYICSRNVSCCLVDMQNISLVATTAVVANYHYVSIVNLTTAAFRKALYWRAFYGLSMRHKWFKRFDLIWLIWNNKTKGKWRGWRGWSKGGMNNYELLKSIANRHFKKNAPICGSLEIL